MIKKLNLQKIRIILGVGGSKLLRSRENLEFLQRFINRQAIGAKVHSREGNSPESIFKVLKKNFVEKKVYVDFSTKH